MLATPTAPYPNQALGVLDMDGNKISDRDALVTVDIGLRFGKREVIADAGRNDWGQRWWLCRCACGWTANVLESEIKRGEALSCITCGVRASGRNEVQIREGDPAGIVRVRNGRWQAQIGRNGRNYYLGSYHTKQDAINARRAAERQKTSS